MTINLRIITLCENTALFGFKAEWGLSMLIDWNDHRLVFDTGMTDVALTNAVRHKIDFDTIDTVVLSHGHLDHTGGLGGFLNKCGKLNVFGHPDLFRKKYSARHSPEDEDISIPLTLDELEKAGATVSLSREPVEIAPGIITSGEVPMETDFENPDKSLLVQSEDERKTDYMEDDLSIALKTPEGLFIILGCAHRGPVNITRHFMNITGESRVYCIVGGFHLSRATEDRLDRTIDFFREINVKKVAPCHCTGFSACCRFEKNFSDNFIRNNSGKRMFFN